MASRKRRQEDALSKRMAEIIEMHRAVMDNLHGQPAYKPEVDVLRRELRITQRRMKDLELLVLALSKEDQRNHALDSSISSSSSITVDHAALTLPPRKRRRLVMPDSLSD